MKALRWHGHGVRVDTVPDPKIKNPSDVIIKVRTRYKRLLSNAIVGYTGKTVGIAGEHLTGAEMAAGMSRALEQPIAYNAVSPAVYRGFDFPGADDLGNMFQYKHDFNDEFCGARSVAFSRSLNAELMSFADWLKKNGKRIPLE